MEVVADGAIAAEAAAAALANRDMAARVVTTALSGEATAEARRLVEESEPEVVSVAVGESTVAVTGSGRGGRNQRAALSIALAIEGTGAVFAALGTDGRDGPTEATGAIVDGGTTACIRAAGIDPEDALLRCDSHPALDASKDLVRIGSTGTNIGDLWDGLASARVL